VVQRVQASTELATGEESGASHYQTYLDGESRLGLFLVAPGMPLRSEALRQEHIEASVASVPAVVNGRTGRPLTPSTPASRYQSLQTFFKWLVDAGEIGQAPMECMTPPHVQEDAPIGLMTLGSIFRCKAV
jgi:hypothetical protein